MQRPMIGHRSGAMEQLLAGIAAPLARLFRTSRPVLVGTTSATGSWRWRCGMAYGAAPVARERLVQRALRESGACLRQGVRPARRAARLRRRARHAARHAAADAGRRGDPGALGESTGVLQDVEALSSVVRDFDDVLLLVDAVTSLAGSPWRRNRWGGGSTSSSPARRRRSRCRRGWRLAPLRTDARAGPRTLPARGLYFRSRELPGSHDQAISRLTPARGIAAVRPRGPARADRARGRREGRWRRHDAMRRRVEE